MFIKCFSKVKFLRVGFFLSVRLNHKNLEKVQHLTKNEHPALRTYVYFILHERCIFLKFTLVKSVTYKKSNT